jgi:uncharacterized repeat protein (TIGR03803 family)
VGDFGNGKLDLAVADNGSQNVGILLGNGDGTFQATSNFAAGTNPSSVTAGAFITGNSSIDLAVANRSGNNVSVLIGNGDGTFHTPVNYTVGSNPVSVTGAAFASNANIDLAVANSSSNNVSVLLGNGDGTFQNAVNYAVGSQPNSVAAGNFNGKIGLAVANLQGASVSVLVGNGDGTFQNAVPYPVGSFPYWVVAANFGNGQVDLAVANNGSSNVSVLLGKGDGTFLQAVPYSAGPNPAAIAVGDYNSDGKLDLAVLNGTGTVSILLGNGNGTFQAPLSNPPTVGGQPTSIVTADFNGDGKLDLVVVNSGNDNISILLGNGDGTFQPSVYYAAGFIADSVAVGDFKGNGKPDLGVANSGNNDVTILLNTTVFKTNTITTITAQTPNPSVPGESVTINFTVVPVQGGMGTPTGNVTVSDAMGDSCTATVAQGSCSITFPKVGTKTLAATYGGDSNFNGSTSKSVTQFVEIFNTVANFNGTVGFEPFLMSLVQGIDGNLYGTTVLGGTGDGTIFKVTPSGTLTTLHSFGGTDGLAPYAGLVLGTDGNFYGTTVGGGANSQCSGTGIQGCGTVFKITPGGTFTTLYSFAGTDGANPWAGLVQGTDGNFYGTTAYGGASSVGTVFKITSGGTLTTLHSFSGSDGDFAVAALIQATDGNFYGTTGGGGAGSYGTVFRMTPSGTLTTLHSFDLADGEVPEAALIQGTDGNLYSTTPGGGGGNCNSSGLQGCGTVFKITTGGTLTTLHSFVGSDGQWPYGPLIQATDGNLYGTTTAGGASASCSVGCGTVFNISLGGTLTGLLSFDSTDGAAPYGGLVQATSGVFYGTTYTGGANNGGTIYSLTVGLGPFVETLPNSGKVGAAVKILGNNLKGATKVTFNGTAATFKVVSSTEITTKVPSGATTGKVQVVTPHGTLSSNVPFRVR